MEQEGITIKELLNILLKRIFLIFLVTILTVSFGYYYAKYIIKPQFQSTTDILVQVYEDEEVNLTETLRIIQTVSEFIQKDVVLKKAITEVGLNESPENIRKNLVITYSTQSFFITIKYTSHNQEKTKLLVDEIVYQAILIAKDDYPILDNTMHQMEEATEAIYVSPNILLYVIVSFFLGVILGVVLALILETLKTTVSSKEELENYLPQYRVLAEIPKVKNINSK